MMLGRVYKKEKVLKERDLEKNIGKRRVRTRTLREESKQGIFLYNVVLLGLACIGTLIFIFNIIKSFFLIFILG